MEVQLTPEQRAFAEQAVKAGRFGSIEDAVREALQAWEEDERTRAEIVTALKESEADLEGGRYRDYSVETLATLAEELKAEGRTLLRTTASRRR
jgi:putative addiction module CopG family antidote